MKPPASNRTEKENTDSMLSAWFGRIAEEIFIAAVVAYLGLIALERFQDGFVSHVFDVRLLLWVALAIGVLRLALPTGAKERHRNNKRRDTAIVILGFCITFFVVWLDLESVLPAASLMALGAALIVTLLGVHVARSSSPSEPPSR